MIAVVILNWNGRDDTIMCLESVLRESDGDLEVIVVDNGSSDDSVQRVRELFPTVTVITSATNTGYAGGNNLGIAHALRSEAQFVCVLNNDTRVSRGMFRRLRERAEGVELSAWSPRILRWGTEEPWFEGIERTGVLGLPVHGFSSGRDGVALTPLLSGCCIFASADVWRRVGDFDESYFLIFEDSEWSRRAREAGIRLCVDDEATLEHRVSAAFGRSGDQLGLYYWTRNAMVFLEGEPNSPSRLSMTWNLAVRPCLRDLRHNRRFWLSRSSMRLAGAWHASRRRGPASARVARLARWRVPRPR